MSRILIIGAGLSGMASALMLHEAGHTVTIISRGLGGMLLANGTIDILGWHAKNPTESPIRDLTSGFAKFLAANPAHPYTQIGLKNTLAGAAWLTQKLNFFDSQTPSDLSTNHLVPTAVGAVRPTAALPNAMRASALTDGDKLLVVGLKRIKDFPANLIADNLSRSPFVSVQARAFEADLPVRDGKETDASSTTHARTLDQSLSSIEVRTLIALLQKEVRPGEKILLPAILGIKPETFADFATQLGVPVGEIPLPPPSIPGRRINDALTQMCRDARIDIQLNSVATGFQNFGKRVTAVEVQRAGRKTNVKVDFVIDGAGGFESGNLTRDSHLRIRESVFNLPLYTPKAPEPDFAAENIFRTGVLVNAKMNPIDADGKLQYENLYCVGSILGGALAWEEKSGEGISLGSAYTAAQAIISSALAKNPGTAAESSANAANKEDN